MAKSNIYFNNKNYSIDDSSLSSAANELKSYLSTTMSGSGATINFDGVSYNIDSTKLSSATNDFVSHLGTISGSGTKIIVGGVEHFVDSNKVSTAVSELEAVLGSLSSGGSTPDVPSEERLEGDGQEFYKLAPTALSFRSTAPLNELQEIQINGATVDPSNYTLEEGSTIVTFPIDYLKTLDVGGYEVAVASEGKTVKGDFAVVTPELNEHGFYYNQPYTANFPESGGDTAFFVREDGTYDIIIVGYSPDTHEYTIDGNNIVATHPTLGTLTCTISEDGTSIYCVQLATNFTLGSQTFAADEDYVYTYIEDLGGYEVQVIDRTKSSYGVIKTGINGIDTIAIGNAAFSGCDTLASISIPDSVTSIEEHAFSACDALTSVIIGSSVTTIGNNAFFGCSALTSVTIGNSVTTIEDFAFSNCSALTSIDISDNVTSIGNAAFSGCDALTSIDIPDNVTSIGNAAFSDCDALTSVIIGSSVTTIGNHAFFNCSVLTSVIFEGTAEQWNAIARGNEWNLDVPATYVQCSDGQVAL